MANMIKGFGIANVSRPTVCKDCEGLMVFEGLGRYKCENCGATEHDDYGKARNYIEGHPGATVSQIAQATGITTKSINNMVKEQRFEISSDSRTFLRCEICGVDIRFGRSCANCESAFHKQYEEKIRKTNIEGGFGKAERDESTDGAKRFKRR